MDPNQVEPAQPEATVLVVDDEDAVRRLLCRVLTRRGFRALEANDGFHALQLITTERVDVVLLDHVLPDLSGSEVLSRIRSDPATATLPVILVTGNADVAHRVSGLEAGADDYLAKPVDLDELVARVRTQLRGRDAWRTSVQAQLQERARMAGALASINNHGSVAGVAEQIVGVLVDLPTVDAASIVAFRTDGTARYLAATDRRGTRLVDADAPVPPSVLSDLEGVGTREGGQLATVFDRAVVGAASGATLVITIQGVRGPIAALVLGTNVNGSDHGDALRETVSAASDLAGVIEHVLVPVLEPFGLEADLADEIRVVIDEHAFHPVYQSIVELEGGRVAGFEALTRFADDVAPDRRFADAAHLGLGLDLELATLRAALSISDRLPPHAYLSVNVSASLLLSHELGHVLALAGDRPVVVELTEHERVDDYDVIKGAIAKLGPKVRLSVDDAGAGWASLRHVLTLKPDFVKVDRAWVSEVDRDPARQALLLGIARFVEELGGKVVGEGIETNDELEALRRLGIPLGQGYYLGRPVPVAQAAHA